MAQIKKPAKVEEAGVTSRGDVYWKITWDDKKEQNIFNQDQYDLIEQAIKDSSQVDVKYVKAGKYWNVESISAVENTTTEVKSTAKPETIPWQGKSIPRDNTTNMSIESQVAVKAITELWIAGKLKDNSNLVKAAENWLASKLSYWSSIGEIEETPVEPKANKLQLAKIQALAKEKGYTPENAIAIMVREYKVASSKELTQEQAEDFINILTEGKFLET